MTAIQMGITIAVCTAATMLTRFLPFVVFSSKDQQPPEVVRYLGRVLPAAIFGMLIVYCLKGVTPSPAVTASRKRLRCWRPSRCTSGSTSS